MEKPILSKLSFVPASALLMLALSLTLAAAPVQAQRAPAPGQKIAAQPKKAFLEASFTLTTPGNPFDYLENDVQVTIVGAGQTTRLPAFFDGGKTWRVRARFGRPGTYRITNVTRNGKAILVPDLMPKSWTVNRAQALSARRQISVDPKNPTRFADGAGTVYYPVGQNVAWNTGTPIPTIFDHMGRAGENWARVWMNHWDRKNLDWPAPGGKLDQLDLSVARTWDGIVQAAERNGIFFQMTLQHHGQYSTRVNSNWGENPWNTALGGFLSKPDDFFTSERARTLTRAKYRYIVARWGYSPNVLAWELFNEVQFTDAAHAKNYNAIADWHREMATFLRRQDRFRHLVTTSSDVTIPHLYDATDYVQPHSYPPDVVAATQALRPGEWKKPLFYGEIGPGTPSKNQDEEHAVVRRLLWGSLMSEASGAAQYWGWEGKEDPKVYPIYTVATAWLRRTGLGAETGMRPIMPQVTTRGPGTAAWGPGADWGKGKHNVFPILPSGTIEGTSDMPSFLQGKAHQDLFTYAEFPVTLTAPATFTVHLSQIAKAGAHVVVSLDGAEVAEREYPASAADQNGAQTLTAEVPVGKHTVRIENTGADWVRVSGFTLSPFGPSVSALGKASDSKAALWLYRRPGQGSYVVGVETATLTLPAGLRSGTYVVEWSDTATGKALAKSEVAVSGNRPLALEAPLLTDEQVAWIYRKP